VLLNRFVRPLNLPYDIPETDANVFEKCARFVSLIPFKSQQHRLNNSNVLFTC
jgi:hypothetical protein